MSNFNLTFCKVYICTKEWPGINLVASHESCAHPTKYAGNIDWEQLVTLRFSK